MQRYIDQKLREHFGVGDKWLEEVLRDENFVKTLKSSERKSLKNLARYVAAGDHEPAERFEPTHFKTLVGVYPSAFPVEWSTNDDMFDSITSARNLKTHEKYLNDPHRTRQTLTTCVSVLKYIKDRDVAEEIEKIEKLLNQLNDLDSVRSGANLAERDGESPDAPSEDGASLAEEDEGPPARRTEDGGLRRPWLYVFGAGVLIIAVIAAALGSRSGNGQPVCSDIGDVELAGPGGSIELAALGGYCTDPDEDDLTFSAASSDNGVVSATVAGDLLTLIAGGRDGGTATITVTATDSDGREATASFGATVGADRGKPTKDEPPPGVSSTGELEPAEPGQPESSVAAPPAADDDSPAIVRGYVIMRVHPLPENDRRGAYRIEFGFLSAEVLASGADRAAVVQANAHLLPPSRYLNEASMLERARANNRNWLRTSPIDVLPLEGDDATVSSAPLLTGRVIMRWNPTAGGRFRIEFGFLPEWAIEAAGGDAQRAVELYANLLPDPGRYLTESRINSEMQRAAPRWLTSSLVTIGRPVTGGR